MTTRQRTPGKVRFTVEDFDRMGMAGIFDGRHVELLDGEIYEVTKNPPHDFAVSALAEALRRILPADRYRVREEKSIEPWRNWWPEPDVVVARGGQREYQSRRPGPADIALLVEVCDTSEQDRTKKLAGYAAADVPVYWILDLNTRRLEVYSQPTSGTYPPPEIVTESESADVAIDGQVVGQIAVADLLPRA
jgi:Uma2 family endonuclease